MTSDMSLGSVLGMRDLFAMGECDSRKVRTVSWVSVGLSPLPVRVTTRIATFLVGNPELNLHFHYYWEGGQPKVNGSGSECIQFNNSHYFHKLKRNLPPDPISSTSGGFVSAHSKRVLKRTFSIFTLKHHFEREDIKSFFLHDPPFITGQNTSWLFVTSILKCWFWLPIYIDTTIDWVKHPPKNSSSKTKNFWSITIHGFILYSYIKKCPHRTTVGIPTTQKPGCWVPIAKRLLFGTLWHVSLFSDYPKKKFSKRQLLIFFVQSHQEEGTFISYVHICICWSILQNKISNRQIDR